MVKVKNLQIKTVSLPTKDILVDEIHNLNTTSKNVVNAQSQFETKKSRWLLTVSKWGNVKNKKGIRMVSNLTKPAYYTTGEKMPKRVKNKK